MDHWSDPWRYISEAISGRGLHRHFESAHRDDTRARAGGDRLVAHRAPDFAVDKNLSGEAGRDRLAHRADLSDHGLAAGADAIVARAGYGIADAEHDRAEAHGGARGYPAIDAEISLRGIDQE